MDKIERSSRRQNRREVPRQIQSVPDAIHLPVPLHRSAWDASGRQRPSSLPVEEDCDIPATALPLLRSPERTRSDREQSENNDSGGGVKRERGGRVASHQSRRVRRTPACAGRVAP
jgi:hypothetical protein